MLKEAIEKLVVHRRTGGLEKTNKDDGFTQTLEIKTGITTKEKVEVKNHVLLQPYRTFREVVTLTKKWR